MPKETALNGRPSRSTETQAKSEKEPTIHTDEPNSNQQRNKT